MAGKLTCEICGGALMAQPGGVFECEFCGTKYSKAWMQEKIQEIKGTVKVEGTVQVEGTVKLDGPVKVEGSANLESLLKRARLLVAEPKRNRNVDEEFKTTVDKLMDADAACAEIYVLKVLYDCKLPSLEALKRSGRDFTEMPDWQKALQFADASYGSTLKEVDAQCREFAAQVTAHVKPRLAQIRPVANLMVFNSTYFAALKSDGTVLLDCRPEDESWLGAVREWTGVAAICSGSHTLLGLQADGHWLCASEKETPACLAKAEGWTGVHKIHYDRELFGLTDDGQLLTTADILPQGCQQENVVDFNVIWSQDLHGKEYCEVRTITADDLNSSEKGQAVSFLREAGRYCTSTISSDGIHYGIYTGKIRGYVGGWRARNHEILHGVDGSLTRIDQGSSLLTELPVKNVAAFAPLRYVGRVQCIALHDDGTLETVDTGVESPYLGDPKRDDPWRPNVTGWRLFNALETFRQERSEAKAKVLIQLRAQRQAEAEAARRAQLKLEMEARKARLLEIKAEAQALQEELASLKGMFTGKRRKEIEERLNVLREEFRRTKAEFAELEGRR